MKTAFTAVLLSVALISAGCDVDVHETAPGNLPANDANGVTVEVDGEPAEDRMELREERRENLREAVDGVDVQVGNGGVSVDVDGDAK